MRRAPGAGRFGATELTEEQSGTLRRAVRLEWTTIGVLVLIIAAVGLVAGQSQAMRTAWVEDMLSLLPPIAFLVAARIARRSPTPRHPYGYHRAVGVGHLVAAVALLGMGGSLVADAGTALLTGDRPPIGVLNVLGVPVWAGWPMVAVMVATSIPPVILGRMKIRLAEELHDKVLFADAAMNKADWMTGLATAAGVLGIGMGLWWADAVAALVVSTSIVADGVTNLRGSVSDLVDSRATTYDDAAPHPLIREVETVLRQQPWVLDVGVRVRDEGHVFHVEGFLVPVAGAMPTLEQLAAARQRCTDLDWKIEDVVLAPVAELPEDQVPC
ncbi:cation diffusion facilitator family transporter [Kocuria turfanensis]|uniref:Cobalt transporter n=1 Tax=Kocuria turfanensis TaxID=388357 RepID=A0A512IEH9_9MICC|nr:cation diffusion facilitator family transporter [Kocuria turfanensis]GEO96090.1 cobalt transporter [Kocuria turfanensis]